MTLHLLEEGRTHEAELSYELMQRTIRNRVEAAWPNIDIAIKPFVDRFVILTQSGLSAESVLDQRYVEDLFLAYACSEGNQKALRCFANHCDGIVKSAGAKFKLQSADFDDFRQELWHRLFIGRDASPMRILDYRGESPIAHWFRVLVTRALLDRTRRQKRAISTETCLDTDALGIAAPALDPELANIRARFASAFRAAFHHAVQTLAPDERNFLKCHYLRGMTSDQIAAAFGGHRSTAARRVLRAREQLARQTRAWLAQNVSQSHDDLDSAMRLLDGEISLSLSRLLA